MIYISERLNQPSDKDEIFLEMENKYFALLDELEKTIDAKRISELDDGIFTAQGDIVSYCESRVYQIGL